MSHRISRPAAVALALLCACAAARAARAQAPAAEAEIIAHTERGRALEKQGRLDEALAAFAHALTLAERGPRQRVEPVVSLLVSVGGVAQKKQDFAKALASFQRAADMAGKLIAPEHPLYLAAFYNLALLHRAMGQLDLAEPHYLRLLPVLEKSAGADSVEVAVILRLLSAVYLERGEQARGLQLLLRSAAITERREPTGTLHMASLHDIGVSYMYLGDFAQSESYQLRSLKLKEQVHGPQHPSVATSLDELATLYGKRHDFDRAARFYIRSLEIKERAHGPNHTALGDTYNKLGTLLSDAGDFARAEQAYQKALAVRERTIGRDHPDYAITLCNIAWLHMARRRFDEAERLYLQGLRIHERAYPPNHPTLAVTHGHLTLLYEAKGDFARAVAHQSRAAEIAEHHLRLILAAGSEQQKQLYMRTLTGETFGIVSLHARSAPASPEAARLALTSILRRKGRVLDAMAEQVELLRRRLTPEARLLFDRLARARTELATLTLAVGAAGLPARSRAAAVELEAEIGRLEAAVGDHSSQFREQTRPVTIESVQQRIPPGAALVEYFLYQPFDAKGGSSTAWGETRLVAYVLRPGCPVAWVELGEAGPVYREIARLREALRSPRAPDLKAAARAVDELLMRPVRPLLTGSRLVLVSPDGALNLIPFAALVDERGRYLVEDFTITYLTSGRDLLRARAAQRGGRELVVFADPSFDQAAPAPA